MSYCVKLHLKELLEQRGITRRELAELTGLRPNTISDITRGIRTGISLEHLGKIATALEIDDIRKIINIEKMEK